MGRATDGAVLREVHRLFDDGPVAGLSEGQLLDRFIARRDEAAFAALVERHGPMVLGVCRRLLRDPHDADDAFQATFLVLVRRARTIRDRDVLGGWLHRVARRVATRAGSAAAARLRRESPDLDRLGTSAAPDGPDRDLIAAVRDELDRLPEKYRAPVVLCDLEEWTHEEAALRLRWPVGTVKGRLSRARGLLRRRLERRGIAAPAGFLALAAAGEARAAVPRALVEATVEAATQVAARKTLAVSTVSAAVAALVRGETMLTSSWKGMALGLLAVGAMAAGASVLTRGDEPKPVDAVAQAAPVEVAKPAEGSRELKPTAKQLLGAWRVVARVDGDQDEIGLPFGDRVVFTPNRIELGGSEENDLDYRLGLLDRPKKIAMMPRSGRGMGQSVAGTFHLDGDTLTIGYAGLEHPGNYPQDPTHIVPGGQVFSVLLRREGEATLEEDYRRLQGNWRPMQLMEERGSSAFDENARLTNLYRVRIRGRNASFSPAFSRSGEPVAGTLGIDPWKEPREFAFAGPEKLPPGIPRKGTYSIQANDLTLTFQTDANFGAPGVPSPSKGRLVTFHYMREAGASEAEEARPGPAAKADNAPVPDKPATQPAPAVATNLLRPQGEARPAQPPEATADAGKNAETPNAIEDRAAEMKVEQELLAMEVQATKLQFEGDYQALSSAQSQVDNFDPENIRLSAGDPRKAKDRLEEKVKRCTVRLEETRRSYLEKSRKLNRLNRELRRLGLATDPRIESPLAGPTAKTPAPKTAAEHKARLEAVDREIRKLEQERAELLRHVPKE